VVRAGFTVEFAGLRVQRDGAGAVIDRLVVVTDEDPRPAEFVEHRRLPTAVSHALVQGVRLPVVVARGVVVAHAVRPEPQTAMRPCRAERVAEPGVELQRRREVMRCLGWALQLDEGEAQAAMRVSLPARLTRPSGGI